MAHLPTKEADDQKVFRIARELGISLEDAAVTCAGFELAFSDDSLRRAIFGIIDRLDDEAAKKGEPLGLILSYAVELESDGIRVGRYADEIPAGQVVNLTPTDRAMISLKIKDNFPTEQFLGPLIVNRPALMSEPRAVATGILSSDGCPVGQGGLSPNINMLPSLAKEGCPLGRGGLIDSVNYDTELPNAYSPSEPAEAFIYDIRTRLTLDERFPFLSAAGSTSFLRWADRTTLNPSYHLPPWAALQAGNLAFQSTSGLSPPSVVGECGHSASKDVPPALAIDVRDTCLTF